MSEIILPNGKPAREPRSLFSENTPQIITRLWNLEDILKTQRLLDQEYHHNAQVTRATTFKKRKLALWVELGELVNEWIELFKYWSNKVTDRAKALEEFVDCLHFIASLGNDLNIPPYHDKVVKFKDPIDQIFHLSVVVANITGVQSYFDALCLFRGLGDHFGFTEDEITKAYYEKNKKNLEREDHNIFSIEPE